MFKKFIDVLINLPDERIDFLDLFDKETMTISLVIFDENDNPIESISIDKDDFDRNN